MPKINYKNKCCGNCEHFIPVWIAQGSNSVIVDYHVCDIYRGVDGAYDIRIWDCYKPATKKHMAEVTKIMMGIIDQISEVEK